MLYVLEKLGYGRLVREPFNDDAVPTEPLRSISGTTAIFCDRGVDDDEVRRRSRDECSRGGSASSSFEVEERVLRTPEDRDLDFRCSLSLSLSLSRSLSLALGLLLSFLRRRGSDELCMSGEIEAGVCDCKSAGPACTRAATEWCDWARCPCVERGRKCAYQRGRQPSIWALCERSGGRVCGWRRRWWWLGVGWSAVVRCWSWSSWSWSSDVGWPGSKLVE